MGRVEENKKEKGKHSFALHMNYLPPKGSIQPPFLTLLKKAGVAKRNFSICIFKDKYDIKNKLIAHKTKNYLIMRQLLWSTPASPDLKTN